MLIQKWWLQVPASFADMTIIKNNKPTSEEYKGYKTNGPVSNYCAQYKGKPQD